jgi:hypothetical protein
MPRKEIAEEFRLLQGDARRIWTDADLRHRLIRHVGQDAPISGMYGGSLLRLDEAIVKGMRALGFRRGRTRGVRITEIGSSEVRGRKTPDCYIHINTSFIGLMLGDRGTPDGVFKNWIHESLHARQPYAPEHIRAEEYPTYQGYEEGLVEGIARWIVRDKAAMAYVESYPFYVRAYETLAAVLGTDVIDVWRSLWPYLFGTIREAFPGIIGRLWYNRTGRPITEAALRTQADDFFTNRQRYFSVSDGDLRAMWREALDDEA